MTVPDGAAPIVVQKYGGTSVATAERIRAIAARVALARRDSPRLVVVLSAMGNTTDGLVALATRSPTTRGAGKWTCCWPRASRSRFRCSASPCSTGGFR